MPNATQEQIQELGILTTRDESGRHFTQWSRYWEALEEMGLIQITRPVHGKTGIEYSQEDWSIEVTEEGQSLVDSHYQHDA